MFQSQLIDFLSIDKKAQELSQIYCNETDCGEKLSRWFYDVDFDKLPSEVTCMSAAIGNIEGYVDVPEQLIPRLRGITKYIHTLNSGMMSGICALVSALNRANIPAILMDETALYVRYPDAPQRQLWQMFIGVKKEDFAHTLEIAKEIGFIIEVYQNVAVARQGVTRQIIITSLADDDSIWDGAREIKKGNAIFLCPKTAAIFIGICQRTFRAFTKRKLTVLHWVMDMKLLLNQMSEDDWSQTIEIAQKEHIGAHIRFMLELYAAVTNSQPVGTPLFGSKKDAEKVLGLLKSFHIHSQKSNRIRRAYLLYRLRRPDSIMSALSSLLRRILKKIKF